MTQVVNIVGSNPTRHIRAVDRLVPGGPMMAEEAFIKTRFYSYGQSGAGSYLYHGSGLPFFDAESEEGSHASDHVSTIDCQYL